MNILDDTENPMIAEYLGDHIYGWILWNNLNIVLDLIDNEKNKLNNKGETL